jgi:hypothetical protein
LTEQNITKTDFFDILKIANFLSNTGYRKSAFYNSRDLKSFLRNAKKYSNILNDNKYELEKLKPIDLFNYLLEKFDKYRYNIICKSNSSISSFMNKSNGVQVFYYSLSENNKDKINSYISTLKSMKKSSIQEINLLLKDLDATYGKEKYKSIIKNVLSSATKYNAKNDNKEHFSLDFDLRNINYDENIFTDEKKIMKLLKDNIDIIQNLDKIKNIKYKNIDDKVLMIVFINTLIQTAKNIYKENTEIYNFIYKIE